MSASSETLLYIGKALERGGNPARYASHLDRQAAFWDEAKRLGLDTRVRVMEPRQATREELLRFHQEGYVKWVETRSRIGSGLIDDEDTPAYPGIYEDQAVRAGSAVDAVARIMDGEARRGFQPIGGLHHARRHRAAGFCVFSDIGVVIETLRDRYGLQQIAYVDIDAHHSDGVFYSYESDPGVVYADIHEDGRYLYPGTGRSDETGRGDAIGTKLNIPLAPGTGDAGFLEAWTSVEEHLCKHEPEFIVMHCGADGIAGDPLADLRFTPAVHVHAAKRVVALAEQYAQGRVIAFGGGGYSLEGVTAAWTGVLRELV